MHKKCFKCGVEKPPEEFPWKNRSSGKKHNLCKECQREKSRRHYRDNKKKYQERNLAKKKEVKAWLKKKKSDPCIDCGVTYPWYVMDFDHREGEDKVDAINRLAAGYSLDYIKLEVGKCDVVCSNCHRERTYQRAIRSSV